MAAKILKILAETFVFRIPRTKISKENHVSSNHKEMLVPSLIFDISPSLEWILLGIFAKLQLGKAFQ